MLLCSSPVTRPIAFSSCSNRFEGYFRLFVKHFLLLDLPIAAGREIVFVRFHLVFADPELPVELVDFVLQRSHLHVEFFEFLLIGFECAARIEMNDFRFVVIAG